MKSSSYFHSIEGAIKLNRILLGILGLLTVSVLILCLALVFKSQPIQIESLPDLDKPAVIDKGSADSEAQIAKGLYLVGLLGNVTPNSVEFLSRNISRDLTPRMYQPVQDAIQLQSKQIKEQSLRLSFSAQLARFDEETKKVVITGEVIVMDQRGNEARELRTYTMGFVSRNYRILLDDLSVAQGAAPPIKTSEQEASQ